VPGNKVFSITCQLEFLYFLLFSLHRLTGANLSLRLSQDHMKFPQIRAGEVVTLKLELRNGHLEDIQVAVTAPRPPFYVKHRHLKIQYVLVSTCIGG